MATLPTALNLPSLQLDPRRTFIAALVLANKFAQDKCYSNRTWAKLVGLKPREISRCERALGDTLRWRLWVCTTPESHARLRRDGSDTDLSLYSVTYII